MTKVKNFVLSKYAKYAGAASLVVAGLVSAFGASAYTLDSSVQDVASTTQNYLLAQFVATLVYVLPTMLLVFVIFWAVRFVWRKIKSQAH